MNLRIDNRNVDQIRDVRITHNFLKPAEGSVLVEFGDTKVICTATIEESVPPFLEKLEKGWITAEYSMLPRSAHHRIPRDRQKSGRSKEIQRLIGRSFRSIVDLEALGKRTIIIDCDVMQADGGTRTASITGGYIALYEALYKLKEQEILSEIPLKELVAAISVGKVDDEILLDLNYSEDSKAEVDMNFVCTESGEIIEIQGTAEGDPFSKEELDKMYDLAVIGLKKLFSIQKSVMNKITKK